MAGQGLRSGGAKSLPIQHRTALKPEPRPRTSINAVAGNRRDASKAVAC